MLTETFNTMSKKLLLGLLMLVSIKLSAQNTYLPYSYNTFQKLNKEVYDKNTKIHSSLKPDLLRDTTLQTALDSVLNVGVDPSKKTWAGRKLFNEHLIDIKKEDYTAYFDLLSDFSYGKASGKTTWLNTRGFQVGGTIGKKFFFYSSGYENQGRFAEYYQNYINTTRVVPGQMYDRSAVEEATKDWSYASALLSYSPNKYLDITVGQDKNFIGDGYRSMLLSDYASSYPFLKLTGHLGNVQYTAMWLSLQEPFRVPQFSYDSGNRRKGAVMHYLDWNINKRLSVGFFDAVVWAQYDDKGNKRGFDWGYANPIIFLRPIEAMNGSPDNAAMGLTGKYEFLSKNAIYGQFFLDEFEAKNFFSKRGSYRNKWGAQIGVRGADLLKVKNLNYLIEFNKAKPYTYTSRSTILTYGHYSEPLAHPYGANFNEAVGILSYSWKRFDVRLQGIYSKYGTDFVSTDHYGKDIYKPYNLVDPEDQTGVVIGQGNTTKLTYIDSRVSYLINPKINFRLEAGAVIRNEKQLTGTNKTNWLTLGLRTSFRSLYQDF